jgi:tetratricopeptide (TPR) repeat protein
LLREAVYADLPGPHRAHLHAGMAELLAGADTGGTRRAAEVARHLRLSGRDGEAVRQLGLAGAHARAVGAIDEAAAFYTEAVELRPDDPDLLLELGEAEAWRGRREASEAAFERAEALLERAGDPLAMARALARLQRWYNGPICYPRGVMTAATRMLEALAASPVDDLEVRRQALIGLGWAEAVAGDVDRADALLDEVAEMVGDTGADDAVTWEIAHARQLALSRRGRFRESYEPALDAGRRALRAERPDLAAGLWINASAAAWAAGDFERAEEFSARSEAALKDTGAHGLELLTLCARVHLLLRMDRLQEASETARRAHAAAERLADPGYVHEAEHSLGLVAMAAGEHERAAELFAAALAGDAAISRPRTRLARAEALAACGRCDEAEQEVRATALEPVGPGDFPHTLVASLTRVQGLIARARGDSGLAARRLEEAAAAWGRITARGRTGDDVNAVFADLGRPAVGLIEPERELARVEAELEELHAAVR